MLSILLEISSAVCFKNIFSSVFKKKGAHKFVNIYKIVGAMLHLLTWVHKTSLYLLF